MSGRRRGRSCIWVEGGGVYPAASCSTRLEGASLGEKAREFFLLPQLLKEASRKRRGDVQRKEKAREINPAVQRGLKLMLEHFTNALVAGHMEMGYI
ncbi:unnamed protein product [Urochloa humidicola]